MAVWTEFIMVPMTMGIAGRIFLGRKPFPLGLWNMSLVGYYFVVLPIGA